jgi:hypothetical protein
MHASYPLCNQHSPFAVTSQRLWSRLKQSGKFPKEANGIRPGQRRRFTAYDYSLSFHSMKSGTRQTEDERDESGI